MKKTSDFQGLTILIVDDSTATLELTRRHLQGCGAQVQAAESVSSALHILEAVKVDLVITDCRMPRVSGLDLVRHVRENLPDTAIMMITGYANVENAVEAVRAGAEEYLPKPFTADELQAAVARILHRRRPPRTSGEHAGPHPALPGLESQAPGMQAVLAAVRRAAESDVTVLLTGESGTGKEVVARAIHYGGPRASAPFVPIHCGAIPDTLFESELFGHVRGAFTGATHSRAGFFQTADGGTVFLDEIGEMSPPMQVKLLRVLQDREVVMVGSEQVRKVDVRIIAATHRNLPLRVRQGRFREDLFWRLHVLPVELPPLRERPEDVRPLIRRFAAHAAHSFGRPEPQFTPRALDALTAYAWPGNIRELENFIQRLTVMGDGRPIDITELPPAFRFSVHERDEELLSLADLEQRHIRRVLAACEGNKTRAAAILGIDRKTLREKLKAAGLPASDGLSI